MRAHGQLLQKYEGLACASLGVKLVLESVLKKVLWISKFSLDTELWACYSIVDNRNQANKSTSLLGGRLGHAGKER